MCSPTPSKRCVLQYVTVVQVLEGWYIYRTGVALQTSMLTWWGLSSRVVSITVVGFAPKGDCAQGSSDEGRARGSEEGLESIWIL